MLWFIYNVIFTVGYILMLPYWFFRMSRRGGYGRRFITRMAIYEQDDLRAMSREKNIWVHAVSVGEVYVALRIVEKLRKKLPKRNLVFTTNTSTGYAIAEKNLQETDTLLYFPSDLWFIMKRAVKLINPMLVILTECEIWPNMVRYAARSGSRVAVVNARLSDSSFRGYRLAKVFFKPVIRKINLICAQNRRDRDRFIELGASGNQVAVTGSCKYDLLAGTGEKDAIALGNELRRWGAGKERKTLVGGSTWPGEEAALMDCYARMKDLFDDILLILVPRHVERTPEIEKEINERGLKWVRRSAMAKEVDPSNVDIILGDTTGELTTFYSVGTVVFVGKSLSEGGGQNFIEPAMLGKPVVVGPRLSNFPLIAEDFKKNGAFVVVKDSEELYKEILRLFSDREARSKLSRQASALVKSRGGAVTDIVNRILLLLKVENHAKQV